MGSFFKKDVLVFWGDRKEVLLSLLLPIVLIVVLNIAFSGLFNDDGESTDIHIGIVEKDNSSLGLEEFEETLNQVKLSEGEKDTILQQAQLLAPSNMVMDFFTNPDLNDWIKTQTLNETEAIELVEEGELHAYVKIPEGFTYEVLSSILLNEEADIGLTIQAEEQSTELRTLQNMVNNFVDSVNLQFALGTSAGTNSLEPVLPQGGIEIIDGAETYSFSQYITFALSALFALFLAQTVAMKTVTERRERVFNRIILANSHPLQFLMGKTMAAFCLSWLQIFLTVTVSQLVFDVFSDKSMEFWLGVLIIFTLFALSIAGLTALFTSISLNLKDENATSGIFTVIIMVMAVLGGSFAPIESLPTLLQKIGEWTPNGLTQTVLLQWIQFTNPTDLLIPIMVLIGFFVICLTIGMAIFPKKGAQLMNPVFLAQWMKDKRKPYLILLFIGLSIIATLVFGNVESMGETTVPVFTTETEDVEVGEWVQLLNNHDSFEFVLMDEEEAREQVLEGKSDVALHLVENDYRLVTATEMPIVLIIEQHVHQVFTEEAHLVAAAGERNTTDLRNEVEEYMESAPIKVQTRSLTGGEISNYDMGMQLLFGFTLFVAMFTIGFKVNGITSDKVSGVWNRLILSPVKKTQMYVGHLLYSFCIGFLQISIVFLIFKYIIGYDLGNLAMILAIAAVFTLSMVSVAMLITGVVKTPEQFYMVYPSIIPIIPIVSGVYMEPGTITNPVLQFIGDIFPLSHGVEAMVDVALFNAGWTDILLPIALMLLIGVLAMGIGINMVERRR